MNKKLMCAIRYLSVLSWAGVLSFAVEAVESNIAGQVLSITVSGDSDTNITLPYTGAVGESFALVDIEIESGMPATLVLDTESERAMLVGLISSLATAQGAIVTGEVVSTCTGDRIDPITKVTFN